MINNTKLQHKHNYNDDDDPLRAAKGFFYNLIVALLFWFSVLILSLYSCSGG